ncbi:TRAP transporter small permease [Telmatospirillum siberiense]|nr:TRAP transporter small permease subunit [Telmatospirillum siberiense]
MKNSLLQILARVDRVLLSLLEVVCITLFAAITVILTLNIVVRFIPFMSMHWFDEILEMLYGALIFYGAAAVWVGRGHFSVGDWLSRWLPLRVRFAYRFLVELASLVFIAIFFKYSLDLTAQTTEATTAFAMSKAWLYACMPISGGIMLIYSIKNMYLEMVAILHPEAAKDLGL